MFRVFIHDLIDLREVLFCRIDPCIGKFLFDIAVRFAGSFHRFLSLQDERFKFLGRYRFGEEITLYDVTAKFLQNIELLFGLHAFRNDRNIQEIGDIDDDFHHPGIAVILEGVPYKLHIQLHRIDRQRRDHIQG